MDGIPLTETGDVDIELTGGFIPDELEIACGMGISWGTHSFWILPEIKI